MRVPNFRWEGYRRRVPCLSCLPGFLFLYLLCGPNIEPNSIPSHLACYYVHPYIPTSIHLSLSPQPPHYSNQLASSSTSVKSPTWLGPARGADPDVTTAAARLAFTKLGPQFTLTWLAALA